MNFTLEQQAVDAVAARIHHAEETRADERENLTAAADRLDRAREAQEIVQLLAQAIQQQAHEKISAVVTRCLEAVFEETAYQFKIEFDRKRGRTEARLVFTRNGLDVDPMTASGGGTVDVASFALRISCLMLRRPKLRRLVVLDEPFRFVSAQFQDRVRDMMQSLAKELKVQIIQVTHMERLCVGKIIEL
jgi:energy-coupling factor transporter ATP-binding protein EcfA2